MNQTANPDADLIYSLFTGVYKPHLVRLALLLDVFTPLADVAHSHLTNGSRRPFVSLRASSRQVVGVPIHNARGRVPVGFVLILSDNYR